MYLVLQTRHIMAKNTIRNSMYFFAVIFFARIEFGYFVCSYKISLRSILQTTHSENQILYLRKKTHSSNSILLRKVSFRHSSKPNRALFRYTGNSRSSTPYTRPLHRECRKGKKVCENGVRKCRGVWKNLIFCKC